MDRQTTKREESYNIALSKFFKMYCNVTTGVFKRGEIDVVIKYLERIMKTFPEKITDKFLERNLTKLKEIREMVNV